MDMGILSSLGAVESVSRYRGVTVGPSSSVPKTVVIQIRVRIPP
jgi:hypothetical protein